MALNTKYSKELYQQFCEENEDALPINYMPWWLDWVCVNGEWLGLVVIENEEIIAIQPLYITKIYGLSVVTTPPLTVFNGLWIKNLAGMKEVNKSKKETKIIQEAIKALPSKVSFYTQNFHYSFKNWLPYFWEKYSQTTRYSYRISDSKLYSIKDLASNIRNKINKASQQLQITTLNDPNQVYYMWSKTLHQNGIRTPLTESQFLALDKELALRGQRTIHAVLDATGSIHGVNYLIHDAKAIYNLILANSTEYAESGASAFLLHHAILSSAASGKVFDFEGSMLEKMNDLFSGFGGEQTAYNRIYKAKSLWIDLVFRFKDRFAKGIR